ncbi:hypothetical protein PR048_000169 [Dryococelus australis]|uniref:C2H2-type domain-containing protein n=1 Tax=Dryococelus australis TaxID=614101 RepID=A0ABQ9IEG9_9NEOP|nr:hypothetical protein PR048_000169 [Dryococelus australis]
MAVVLAGTWKEQEGLRRMAASLSSGRGISSGAGSFACPDCHKTYRYKRNMVSHLRFECNKEPQFCCPYCPHRYKQKATLTSHVATKHSGMSFFN